MSKFVKHLLTEHLRKRLEGVEDAMLVDVIGLDAGAATSLRQELRRSQIELLVVKNSLARRAMEGELLGRAFEGFEGSAAVVWGPGDFVGLAKQIVKLSQDKKYEKLTPRGGVMDGTLLNGEEVVDVSKWPSREEVLSLVSGQILSPGARLASQLIGPGGKLQSQLEKKAEVDAA